MRKPVTVGALVVCACLLLGHSAWARGKIVLSHDEWPLSATGFSQAPDAATFAQNIASWFTGGGTGHFLVFSSNFSLTGSSPFCPTLIGPGHTCTVDTSLPFDVPTLAGFDGIFLAGKANGGIPDNTVLIQYVENGGHVYLAGGTGEFRDASEEAAAWNTFLNHFGLGFEGAVYNGIGGTLPIRSSHPIFVGVRSLYQDNGNDISTLDPARPCQVLVSSAGHGLYAACSGLPPDPATVAPPLNPSEVTDLAPATEFLYTGANPIQTEVAAGTIEARRVAVLRGRVMTRDGTPLPGVTITVLHHPEFGRTLSRADGVFDLAVNGGGPLRVDYTKSGFLPAQRQVQVPWQDYAWLPDAVLVPLDPVVNAIDLTSSAPMQVARGSVATDADGTRQATVLFPQGTRAQMVSPSGLQRPTLLSVRTTEYTVGASGHQAMPAELPPTSAYTYAVELSVDEASAAGATEVRFSQPVPFYVENFLNLPVGGAVPTGYYDRGKGQWVASDDGRIIRILSVTNGLADLDIDGSNTVASDVALAALGVTDAERVQLVALYPPGQSIWRVPISHFSPWDCNWPYGPPEDAEPPNQPDPDHDPDNMPPEDSENTCEQAGSIIECQNQILGERVGILGTSFSLNYRSDRVPGRKAANVVDITLSGEGVPASLQRITLEILVAGQRFNQTFPAAPNQSYTFIWDGRDAYGRRLQGEQPVTVRIGYVYGVVYLEPSSFQRNWARISGSRIEAGGGRTDVTLWQEWQSTVGYWDAARSQDGGGWTLDVHHTYDAIGRVLHLGDGRRRRVASNILSAVIGSAVGFPQNNAEGLALTPDGSLYVSDFINNVILRVAPDGSITAVADRTRVNAPLGLEPGPGGTEEVTVFDPETGETRTVQQPRPILYIADTGNQRILALITAGGQFFTLHVAGSGTRGFNGDDIPATSAHLDTPQNVALGRDGSLFIADSGNHRVRQVRPDGIITTVAGTGSPGFSGDGGLATQAQLNFPVGLALGPDGSLYIADSGNHRIRRVGTDGIITTVGGTGTAGFSGDGDDAILAQLNAPLDLVATTDGGLFVTDSGNQRVRLVQADGIITTVAGSGVSGFSGDGGPATQAQLARPTALALSPDGTLYLTDNVQRIRRLLPPLPGRTAGTALIAAEDGRRLYEFGPGGRHLRTIHALTGMTLYSFTYDAAGYLSAVTDGDGNVTTIERDANGNPTAIVAPFGQRAALSLDDNGYLASVTNPAGEVTRFGYTADGLLTSFTDAKGGVRHYTYDAVGRLTRAEDPAGGFGTLARTTTPTAFQVAKTDAVGRVTTYLVDRPPSGGLRRVNTFPDGTRVEALLGADGRVALPLPDGTTNASVDGPDPRWGMQAPVTTSHTVTTPGGLIFRRTVNRTAVLSEPNNPLRLAHLTATVAVNGRTSTRTFDAAARQVTATSAEGRQILALVNAQGRLLELRIAGLEPFSPTYDAQGRRTSVVRGSGPDARVRSFAYDSQGRLATLTNPLSQTVGLAYDAAGRIIRRMLPDGRDILTTYDANGNITSITPPGRPAHSFEYTAVNRTAAYMPPDVGAGNTITRYAYNLNKELTQITRPDGATVGFVYDNAGRVSTVTLPRGTVAYTYDPGSGYLRTATAPDGGTLSMDYDGRLLTGSMWTGAIQGTVTRMYNGDFRLASQRVNDDATVDFQYDRDGLLIQAGALTVDRSPQNGLITGTSLGSLVTSRSQNGFGEVDSYTATFGGNPVFAASYTRDQLGRITQKTETVAGVIDAHAYTYDPTGRLSMVSRNNVIIATYTYDSNGNRLSITDSGGTLTATYDAQDRLLQHGSATYTYTANGELASKTVNADLTTYQYDAVGNLMAVSLPDGTRIEYIVDGLNRRIGKRVNGTLVQGFLYKDRLRLAAELDGNNNIVSRFVYATRRTVPDYMVKAGNTYRIISDPLGSPRLVIDVATGTLAQQLEYDAFGNIVMDTSPGFQPFGFAGGLYDTQTRLTRFGARDYDAEAGRWTAKDPLRFRGGLNFYAYVHNDPVNFNDPSGRQTDPIVIEPIEPSDIVERVYPGIRDPAAPAGEPGESDVPEDFVPLEERETELTDLPAYKGPAPGYEDTDPDLRPADFDTDPDFEPPRDFAEDLQDFLDDFTVVVTPTRAGLFVFCLIFFYSPDAY